MMASEDLGREDPNRSWILRPGSCRDVLQRPGSCRDVLQRQGSCTDALQRSESRGDVLQRSGSCTGVLQRPDSCTDVLQGLGSCTDLLQKLGSCRDVLQGPGSCTDGLCEVTWPEQRHVAAVWRAVVVSQRRPDVNIVIRLTLPALRGRWLLRQHCRKSSNPETKRWKKLEVH